MKKFLVFGFWFLGGVGLSFGVFGQSSFYALSAEVNGGGVLRFEELRGKKVMIVNTASKCSLSPQFRGMQELYEEYQDQGLVILAFPTNDFGNREPGNNFSIRQNLKKRFGITFPLMKKITVKGEDIHPVYKWLTQKELNGVKDSEIKWNFQKYLINEKGDLIESLDPIKKPNCKEVIDWIGL